MGRRPRAAAGGGAAAPSAIEELGARLLRLRTERAVTLDQLAERTGFSKGYLSRIENGKKTPPLGTLARVAKALGTQLNALLEPPAASGAARDANRARLPTVAEAA